MSFVRPAAPFVLALGLAAFSPTAHAQEAPAAQDAPAATTAPAAEAMKPVDFRKLKELLPPKLIGLAKGDATGQRTKLGEATLVTVEATYGKDEGDAPKYAKLTLTDYGTAAFAKAVASWLVTEVDQESDHTYTKTADVQGRRALLTYDSAEKHGNAQTLAGGRTIVALDVYGVSDEEFKKALEELPLKPIDALVTAK